MPVRLLEIDAPESGGDGRTEECYAAEATDALGELMPVGGEAWAEADRDLRDRYDRTLLYLWVRRGRRVVFVNQHLVEKGFAVAVLFEPNDRYIDLMRDAQSRAEHAARGLWGTCDSFGARRARAPG